MKSHVFFTKQQRLGIFILIGIIIILQLIYFFVDNPLKEVLYNQEEYERFASEIDSLRQTKLVKSKSITSSFNPNFISDYQGSRLGMSNEEIDRLLAYRKENKWINSTEDFKKVTQVSDSLLNTISPYFKFPDWVSNPKPIDVRRNSLVIQNQQKKIIDKQDLNKATAEELKKVNGVGEVLSERIVKFRNKFEGGFISDIQLRDVYGLQPEIVERILKEFTVKTPRIVKKIDLNSASKDQLSKIQHINYDLATKIIEERTLKEGFKSWADLAKVKDFPINKLEIIKLYLLLEKENE